MRKLTLFLMLACVISLVASAQSDCQAEPVRTRFPVKVGTKYAYIDRTGHLVIKPQFATAGPFSEGRAMVTLVQPTHPDTENAYIDESGNVVAETGAFPVWADVFWFSEGLAPTCVNGCGYFDRSGKLAIPRRFDYVRPFSEGLAAVGINEKVGYIDNSGELVIPVQFDSADPFSEGAG